MKSLKQIFALSLILFSINTMHCIFGSKNRAEYYATMYQINDSDYLDFLKAIEKKETAKVSRFLSNNDFIQNASENVFNAARRLAEEKGNKELVKKIWMIQNQQ